MPTFDVPNDCYKNSLFTLSPIFQYHQYSFISQLLLRRKLGKFSKLNTSLGVLPKASKVLFSSPAFVCQQFTNPDSVADDWTACTLQKHLSTQSFTNPTLSSQETDIRVPNSQVSLIFGFAFFFFWSDPNVSQCG